jgi:hypothetical protein
MSVIAERHLDQAKVKKSVSQFGKPWPTGWLAGQLWPQQWQAKVKKL